MNPIHPFQLEAHVAAHREDLARDFVAARAMRPRRPAMRSLSRSFRFGQRSRPATPPAVVTVTHPHAVP
jgi:hypothetical protein